MLSHANRHHMHPVLDENKVIGFWQISRLSLFHDCVEKTLHMSHWSCWTAKTWAMCSKLLWFFLRPLLGKNKWFLWLTHLSKLGSSCWGWSVLQTAACTLVLPETIPSPLEMAEQGSLRGANSHETRRSAVLLLAHNWHGYVLAFNKSVLARWNWALNRHRQIDR